MSPAEFLDEKHQKIRTNILRQIPGVLSELDVHNTHYERETAGECKELIPVYYLRLSRRPTIIRKTMLDKTVAEILRIMHNNHAQDPLPLCDNDFDPNSSYANLIRHLQNKPAQEDSSA
ncbi:hypothetical protein N7488_000018 [Penicillium malachiteum]|nr:hypothetical protein N7488_000018 [Penicillium malachiteum]